MTKVKIKELTTRKECQISGEVFIQDDVLAEIEELEKKIKEN